LDEHAPEAWSTHQSIARLRIAVGGRHPGFPAHKRRGKIVHVPKATDTSEADRMYD
jgi:hypothetical protein